MENWRPVVGFEGLYSVSDIGRVKSEARIVSHSRGGPKRLPERILRPQHVTGRKDRPYPHVTLCAENEKRLKLIHILVLEAFIGLRPAGMEACHNDGDQLNFVLSNLRWDTPAGNAADRRLHGTSLDGERHHSVKLTKAQMLSIRGDSRMNIELAVIYGVSNQHISRIKRGVRWAHVH